MTSCNDTINPAETPDTGAFIDIKNNHALLRYFQNLQKHFMVANNFGLALDDEDRPGSTPSPAYLRNLFVPPHLSERYFNPEQLIEAEQQKPNWLDATQVLQDHPRLFILGDPGTGKSTLLSWLMLALSYSGDNLTKMNIGERVPFLLLLRDLPLSQVKDWDSLWQVFLANNDKLTSPISTDIRLISQLFESGQALLLIDGLDEVTELKARQRLGQAVLEGINRFPRCSFVMTSRLLGFDQLEWLGLKNKLDNEAAVLKKLRKKIIKAKDSFEIHEELISRELANVELNYELLTKTQLPVFYLSPFDLSQTQQFIGNWYRQYLSNDTALPQRIADLQQRISQNDGLGRLARIPVLLNMICFIHSRRGRLPDGRAELYQRISETYLTSLDRARGLKFLGREFNYDYLDLCDWLGKLALELQDKRAEDDQALLIGQQQVKNLLRNELSERGMGEQQIDEEIDFILSYIAQRSGLFIPRGADTEGQEQYGFSHLSFMEYFAAYALKLEAQIDNQSLKQRRATIGLPQWHECWTLFFEQIEQHRLCKKYFDLLKPTVDSADDAYWLWPKIVMDSAVRFDIQTRQAAISQIWDWYISREGGIGLGFSENRKNFFEQMWQDNFDCKTIFSRRAIQHGLMQLSVSGPAISDLSTFLSLPLTELELANSDNCDWQQLVKFEHLTKLDLFNVAVDDLALLTRLIKLADLGLWAITIPSLYPLQNLAALKSLTLGPFVSWEDHLTNIELPELNELFLSGESVIFLKQCSNLKQLQRLYLHKTGITDLSILTNLSNLSVLSLTENVTDVSVLASLPHLKVLRLIKTDQKLEGLDLLHANKVKIEFLGQINTTK